MQHGNDKIGPLLLSEGDRGKHSKWNTPGVVDTFSELLASFNFEGTCYGGVCGDSYENKMEEGDDFQRHNNAYNLANEVPGLTTKFAIGTWSGFQDIWGKTFDEKFFNNIYNVVSPDSEGNLQSEIIVDPQNKDHRHDNPERNPERPTTDDVYQQGGVVKYQTEGNRPPKPSLQKPSATANDEEKRNYYLNLYSNRNFVQRIIDPDLNIGKEVFDEKGLKQTHYMVQIDNLVIPMVVEDVYGLLGLGPGQFHKFNSTDEAIKYAQETGEYIQTDSEEEALWLSKNYKTDEFNRTMGHKKGGFVVSKKWKANKALEGYKSSQKIVTFQNGGIVPDINVPENFYEFLRENENAGVIKGKENKHAHYYKKPGDTEPKFYPYSSVEGGQQTIGFGRKLNQKDDYKDGVLINQYAKGLTYDQAMAELYKSVEDKHNTLQTRWGDTDWLNELSPENYAILLNHEFQVRRKDNVIDIDWNTREPIEGSSTSRKGAARYPGMIQAMIEGDYDALVNEYIVGSSAGTLGRRNDDLLSYFIEPQKNKYHFRKDKNLSKDDFYFQQEGMIDESGKILENKKTEKAITFGKFRKMFGDKDMDVYIKEALQRIYKDDINSKYKSGQYQSDGFIGPKQESAYSNFDPQTESLLLATDLVSNIDVDKEIEKSKSQGDYKTALQLENVKNLVDTNRFVSLTEHIPSLQKWKRLHENDDKVDINVVVALQELEQISPGITQNIFISSAHRDAQWNHDVGGQKHSRHLYGMGLDLVGPGLQNMIEILHHSSDPNIIDWRTRWTSDKHGNAGRGVIDEGNHLHLNFVDVLGTGATWDNYNTGDLPNINNKTFTYNSPYVIPTLGTDLPQNNQDEDFNVLDQYRNDMLSSVMNSSGIPSNINLFQNRETDNFNEFIKRPAGSKGADIFGPRQTTIALQPWDDWRTLRQIMDTQDPDDEKLKIKT